ncbi:ESX secretion-associated protein EspG [Nocardia vinacea]|uniref:ESX secretion-associated protein EspG n=1 Tax=Nocardia vinacea TaxID=96468 RepID=A0ABZ1YWU6_9NOCA|nr:ESX secretion-associated protein EspG [Nocardia vinacea]
MAEWTWEPDDFAALWFAPGINRFPNPLRFTSRFPYREDFDAHRITVRERYSRDEGIRVALRTLTTCAVRIEIFGGTTEHNDPNGDVHVYRVVGASAGEHAMSLAQSTFGDANGPICCRLFPADHLPAQLVDCLPPCKTGTRPQVTEDLGDRPESDTPPDRYQHLLHRPADGGGSALLYTGPADKPNKPLATVQWHDITDDGRYTELHDRHRTVRPTTPTDLAAHFTTWIVNATRPQVGAEPDRT